MTQAIGRVAGAPAATQEQRVVDRNDPRDAASTHVKLTGASRVRRSLLS